MRQLLVSAETALPTISGIIRCVEEGSDQESSSHAI